MAGFLGGGLSVRFTPLGALLFPHFVSRAAFDDVNSFHLLLHQLLNLRLQRQVLLLIPILEVLFPHLQYRIKLLLMLDLRLLPALVGALVIVQDTGSDLVEAVIWFLVRTLLSEEDGWCSSLGEGSVGFVSTPIHASVVEALLGLLVPGILTSRYLVFEWNLSVLECFFGLFDVLRVFWVYFAELDSLGPLLILQGLSLHAGLLLIKIVLQLLIKRLTSS